MTMPAFRMRAAAPAVPTTRSSRRALLLLGMLALGACTPADTLRRAEGDSLKAEIASLEERVRQLEATVKTLSAARATGGSPTVSLADSTDPARRLGRAEAPVVIVEFSDLECPYCRRFDRQTLPMLKSEYLDTGKVRFESRDFPLDFHPQAIAAALLARCAARQGRFWELREAVYALPGKLSAAGLTDAAQAVGLGPDQRAECARDEAGARKAIDQEKALGQSIGVQGTPSFLVGRVINGKIEGTVIVGAGSIDTFRKRLDPLLAEPTR